MVVAWQDVTGRSSKVYNVHEPFFASFDAAKKKSLRPQPDLKKSPVPMQKIREPYTQPHFRKLGASRRLTIKLRCLENDGTPEDFWVFRNPQPRVRGQEKCETRATSTIAKGGYYVFFWCTITKSQSQRRFWHSLWKV